MSAGGTAWESPEDEYCIPNWIDTAPMIQIRDAAGGYTTCWYANDGYDMDTNKSYPAWCDAEGFVNKVATVTIGQAAWILNSTGKDVTYTVAGAMPKDAVSVGGNANVFLLQGGNFPISFDINNKTACEWNLTGGDAWESDEALDCIPDWNDNAPMIQIRDENGGYTTAWYANDGYDMDDNKSYPAWCDEDGFVVKNVTVPASAGFWLWAPEGNDSVYLTVNKTF